MIVLVFGALHDILIELEVRLCADVIVGFPSGTSLNVIMWYDGRLWFERPILFTAVTLNEYTVNA